MDAPRPNPERKETGPRSGPVDWQAVGLRKTPQRQVVLDLVRGCFDHPTAEWIHRHARERIPEISLATVYRTLRLLKEKGLIHEFSGGASPSRFDGTVHDLDHEHVRCIRCGAVKDVPLPEVGDIRERVAERSGYRVGDFPLVFHGLCATCARKGRGKADRSPKADPAAPPRRPDRENGSSEKSNGTAFRDRAVRDSKAPPPDVPPRSPREDRRSPEDFW